MDIDGLTQSLSAYLGRDVPVRLEHGGTRISVDLTKEDFKAIVQRRPGGYMLKELQQDRNKADAFLSSKANSEKRDDRIISCSLLRGRADDLRKQGKFDAAKIEYENATKAILGRDSIFPLPVTEGLRNEAYTKLHPWDRIVLMECCNGMAQCMINIKRPVQVRRSLFGQWAIISDYIWSVGSRVARGS
jgi:hypothetical protein